MTDELKKIKDDIGTYIHVCQHIIEDIEYTASNSNTLLYNLDFCILYPYLWKTQPKSIPRYKPYGSRIFEILTFINEVKPNFKLVFTGPSFWELLDSITHQIKYLKGLGYRAVNSHQKIMNLIDKRITELNTSSLESQLLTAGVAKQELSCLQAVDFSVEVSKPIQTSYNLIGDDSVLQGLGDYVKYNQNFNRNFQNIYQKIFEDMYSKRTKSMSETRDVEDRRFHYGVDSANITSLHAINYYNTDVRLCYISDPPLINNWCPQYGRNPLVPYYWISSMLLKKDNYVSSEKKFFESMLASAQKIKYDFDELASIEDMPGYLTKSIVEFYHTYALPLKNIHGQNENNFKVNERDGEFQDFINDPKKFKERFYLAAEQITVEAKKLLEEHSYFLEDELVQLTDFKSSPVLAEIKETLRIDN